MRIPAKSVFPITSRSLGPFGAALCFSLGIMTACSDSSGAPGSRKAPIRPPGAADLEGKSVEENQQKSDQQSPNNQEDPSQSGEAAPTDPGQSGDKSLPLTENQAFSQTLQPLLVEHCAACHATLAAPLLAQKDPEAGRLAVIESGKVNFSAIEKSRLYLRLAADNHNCWSNCSDDATAIKSALTAWLTELQKIDPDFLNNSKASLITEERLFADAEMRQPTPDPLSIILEAESGTLTAPMTQTQDAMASGGRYIAVNAGNGGTVNNPNQRNIGVASFNFTVATAGTYKVWALLNAAADANNAFFIRMDNGAFEQWSTPITMANWEWSAANRQDGQAELSFNLAAGNHTVEIRRRDVATKLDRLAITRNQAFDGSQADTRPLKIMRYDISQIAGKANTFLEIEIDEFSAAAFKLRRPAIVSEQPLTVKGLRVLINGQYDPQHNTYNLTDVAVTPPRTELSRAAMVVLKDKGLDQDKISFSFEALQ